MKELTFKCELLSDIVLNASGASEGRLPTHDFIPGSNFLGIVAQKYQDAGDMAYELFHSGNVRFGDAHVMLAGQRSHKVPACWFYLKGESLQEKVWLHHKLGPGQRDKLVAEGKQFKQARFVFFAPVESGFVLADLSKSKQYTMKSAYDRLKRKAADSQLFGYTALQPGSLWEFSVCLENNGQQKDIIAFIKDNLKGECNVGRSRSAQYGRVNITLQSEQEVNEGAKEFAASDEISLYAESRLSFLDKFGQPTLQPTPEDLGMPVGSTIIWEKSQILTSRYAPWNGKRQTRDADRVCIDKGSVFMIRLQNSVPSISLFSRLNGRGIYKNEGFGQVLVEPDFLQTTKDDGTLEKLISVLEQTETDSADTVPELFSSESNPQLFSLLNKQKEKAINNRLILESVNTFVKDHNERFSGEFASQWGVIRATAARESTADSLMTKLFAPNTGYLCHGVAVAKWQKKGRFEIFKTFLEEKNNSNPDIVVPLTIKLATEMAKTASLNQQEGK